MSEEEELLFEATFNRSVKLRARDQRLSSVGGVVLLREADQRLGLIESIADQIEDPRDQALVRYHCDELLRERIFIRALGFNADDEADNLAHDPAMRIATWNRPGCCVLDERCASQPTQSRLTSILATRGNRSTLRWGLVEWLLRHQRANQNRPVRHGTLDVDSFPLTVYGSQEGAAYNGYYGEKVYHPLVASFAPGGDYDSKRLGDGFVHGVLRPGNAHTANGAVAFIREAVARASDLARHVDVRLDAGFTTGDILDPLADDGIRFLGRLKTNAILEELAAPLLVRPVGRPPRDGYEAVFDLGQHRARSWRHTHRLILVVVDKPDPKTGQLEMFPRHFFLLTNWKDCERTPEMLLEHYRKRGTFEDRIGELAQSIAPRMSSPKFNENEVNFLISLLSHNLLSMIRGELESDTGNGWDVARVQHTVLRAAVRVTKGGRRLLVDVALATAALWRRVLESMQRWQLPARWPSPRGPKKRAWVPPPSHAFLATVLRE